MFWNGSQWVPEPPGAVAPAPRSRNRRLRETLATIPIVLLFPVLVFPFLGASASVASSTLSFTGSATPGGTLAVVGTNFTSRDWIALQWDGAPTGVTLRVPSSGQFTTPVLVPVDAVIGSHQISATVLMKQKGSGQSKIAAPDSVVAVVTVTVTSGTSATPTPTPTPAATPTQTPAATPTPTPTPLALTISGVSASNVEQSSATISWTVSEPATGQVEYGTSTAYGTSSVAETSFNYTTHAQDLIGLTAGTLYHYRVRSSNALGTVAISGDNTFVTAVASSPTPTPSPTPTLTPPASISGAYPTDTTLSYVATPSLARPGYLAPIIDPTWGTRITRVADQSVMGTSSSIVRHAYSKMQPWNADGTRLLLSWQKPSPMLDGNTYALIRMADIPSDFRWSSVDPNAMYGYNGGTGQFVRLNATTDVRTVVHTFPGTISIGNGEGNASNDDRYWPIQSGGTVYIYDLVTDTVVGQRTFSPAPDNVTMSPSGAYVVLNFEFLTGDPNGGGVQVWDRGLTGMQRRLVSYGVHGDVCRDTAGNEVWVQAGSNLPMYRLSTGSLTNLLPAGSAYGQSHVSCRNTDRPGWVYVSDYAAPTSEKGSDQVVAVKLDGSGTVEAFGHQHHATFPDYEMEPQAVPSRDGTRILWASEWGLSTGPVYDYVAAAR